MKTRLTLRPGQNGTKKLHAKYGERLVAVRYRYDEAGLRRVKTVELVEEVLPWDPAASQLDPATLVSLRIGHHEGSLCASIKAAGGIWRPERKLWQLPYRRAESMGLVSRIVPSGEQPA